MTKQRILSEADIDYLENRLKETFPTKEEFTRFKEKMFNTLDKILKEVVASREEQIVLSGRTSDHEDRIETLEEIHPPGKHSS